MFLIKYGSGTQILRNIFLCLYILNDIIISIKEKYLREKRNETIYLIGLSSLRVSLTLNANNLRRWNSEKERYSYKIYLERNYTRKILPIGFA